jgi:hypothetical protein
MKTILTLLFFTISIFTSFSQDILTYKNGKTQKVIVLTTTENDITCQDFETKDQFTISRSFLTSIEYQAGKTEPFGVPLPKKIKQEPAKNSDNAIYKMADTVHYQNGYIYYKGYNYSKPADIESILLSVPNRQVSEYLESYKTNRGIGNVLVFVGGFGMGWPVGGVIAGRKFDTGLFLGGVAVATIGVFVAKGAMNQLKYAADSYNKALLTKKISWSPVLYQSEHNQMNAGIALSF